MKKKKKKKKKYKQTNHNESWHYLSNISATSWGEQVNYQRDDDEVQDQHAEMDFYSASSLK